MTRARASQEQGEEFDGRPRAVTTAKPLDAWGAVPAAAVPAAGPRGQPYARSAAEAMRLQRTAGNAAASRLLSTRAASQFLPRAGSREPAVQRPAVTSLPAGGTVQRETATVQRDSDEATALAAVEQLPAVVLSGGGAVPLATTEQKQHFLRAGREWFGSNDATLEHFRGIEQVAVPGGPHLHRSAKSRLEAAFGTVAGARPSSTVAFAFRRRFDADTHHTGASMHTLGYAIDYDATNMPRIGRPETAELLRLTGGGPSNAQLGEYSQRRATIRATGDATEQGTAEPAGAAGLLDAVRSESDRLAAVSQAFQSSLGTGRDQFLELRTQYFEAATPQDRTAVLAQVPALIAPWTAAIDQEERRVRGLAGTAGVDPAAIPSRRQLTAQIQRIEQAGAQAAAALRRLRGAEPPPTSPLWARLARWEQQVPALPSVPAAAQAAGPTPGAPAPAAPAQTPGPGGGQAGSGGAPAGNFAERVSALAERVQRSGEVLRPLIGGREILDRLVSLRTKLGQPAFLFGSKQAGRRGGRPSTQVVADTPSMAQLLERGFYRADGASGGNHVTPDLLVALARHGFELGMAWGGESTDSMHMELVVPRGG